MGKWDIMWVQFSLLYDHLKSFVDNLLDILVPYPGNHDHGMSIDFLLSVWNLLYLPVSMLNCSFMK